MTDSPTRTDAPTDAPVDTSADSRDGAQDVAVGTEGNTDGRIATPGEATDLQDPFAGAEEHDASRRIADLETQIADLNDQLLRSRAELVNYRRRVEEQRSRDRDSATIELFTGLVTILDDIDRAESHEELTGGMGAVARRLRDQLASLGLTRYGDDGDRFDPNIHNAIAHLPVADVTEPVCLEVITPGYTYRDKTVRVAQVAVATPQS